MHIVREGGGGGKGSREAWSCNFNRWLWSSQVYNPIQSTRHRHGALKRFVVARNNRQLQTECAMRRVNTRACLAFLLTCPLTHLI